MPKKPHHDDNVEEKHEQKQIKHLLHIGCCKCSEYYSNNKSIKYFMFDEAFYHVCSTEKQNRQGANIKPTLNK